MPKNKTILPYRRILMKFYRIQLPKAVVYLDADEIHSLLLKDIPLYKQALSRGKAFSRAENLEARIQQKRG